MFVRQCIRYICVITVSLIQARMNLSCPLHCNFQQDSEMCHAVYQVWRDGCKLCKVYVLKRNFSLRVLQSVAILPYSSSWPSDSAHAENSSRGCPSDALPANKNQKKKGSKRGWKPIFASSGTEWCTNSFKVKDCVGGVSWSLWNTANPTSLGHIPPCVTHSKILCNF